MNAQMGIKGKDQAFDTLGMYNAATEALQAGLECDKYDQKPDAKGKVKPRFAAANNTRLWGVRAQLVNAGQEAAQKGKDADVLKYWGTFLDTNDAPLFASQDKSSQKEYFGQVALFTAQYAFQAKDKERAGRYCDLAMKDPEQADRALGIKLLVMRDGLKTKADSVKFVDELKALYAQKPDNGVVLESLANSIRPWARKTRKFSSSMRPSPRIRKTSWPSSSRDRMPSRPTMPTKPSNISSRLPRSSPKTPSCSPISVLVST